MYFKIYVVGEGKMTVSEDNKLNVVKDLYVHWHKNYWNSAYIFLIIQGLIIVALTEVLKATGNVSNENKILSMLVLSGIIFSIIWCFVLNRKYSFIYHSQNQLKEKLGSTIWDNIDNCSDMKKHFWYFSFIPTNIIIDKILMTGFVLFWLIMGYFINVNIITMIVVIVVLFVIIVLVQNLYKKYDTRSKKGK